VVVTHVELVSAVLGLDCVTCGEAGVQDVVLVNEHGLVLLRGRVCTTCGTGRHRPSNAGDIAVPAPRLSA
jgi:hypothetical protein